MLTQLFPSHSTCEYEHHRDNQGPADCSKVEIVKDRLVHFVVKDVCPTIEYLYTPGEKDEK
jgi:hypothetical protein